MHRPAATAVAAAGDGCGKFAALGELTADAAHEINNPLFAILGLVELLLRDSEPGTKAHARLLLVQETGNEIKEIVRALLDFAREPTDERSVVPLAELTRQTLALVRLTTAKKDVEIVDEYADESPVDVVPNVVKQTLLALAADARRALPNGGRMTVRVDRDGGDVVAAFSAVGVEDATFTLRLPAAEGPTA